MQVLSKEDTETLNLCNKMMESGECPPLMVVYDPLEGLASAIHHILCLQSVNVLPLIVHNHCQQQVHSGG